MASARRACAGRAGRGSSPSTPWRRCGTSERRSRPFTTPPPAPRRRRAPTTARNTSSSEGSVASTATSDAPPREERRATSAAASRPARRARGAPAPNGATALHARGGRASPLAGARQVPATRHQQPVGHPGALERRRRVERDQPAVDHQADAPAVLRLVEVMGRDEHGGPLAREVADDAPEAPGAPPGPRPRWARRGRRRRAGAGARRRARAAAACRRGARRWSRRRGPEVRRARAASSTRADERLAGEAVGARRRSAGSRAPAGRGRARTSGTCSRWSAFTAPGSVADVVPGHPSPRRRSARGGR